MLGVQEHQLTYIPFSTVAVEKPYRFRLPDADRDAALKKELDTLGQLHPMTVESSRSGHYQLLDGHRRWEAIKQLRQEHGWEQVLVQIIDSKNLSLSSRFKLIHHKNSSGSTGFGLIDMSRFFCWFRDQGMPVLEMASIAGLLPPEADDLCELEKTPEALLPAVNQAKVPASFALLLLRQHALWKNTVHAALADTAARRVFEHARDEQPTMKAWRFLIDFYWGENRPFLARPKPS